MAERLKMKHLSGIENPTDKALVAKAFSFDQGHIFRFWDELSPDGRSSLLEQIAEIDFDLMARLIAEHITNESPKTFQDHLELAPIIGLPQTEEEKRKQEEARGIGEAALQDGKVAALVVAGGQGTRLGFDHPKGAFTIGPVSGKSLFQIHAEKILALCRKFGSQIPWYIMTSRTNDQGTREFLEQNDFFGLPQGDVFLFQQGMLPAVDKEGKFLMEAQDHISTSPNGHGGTLLALADSGALEDMHRGGIQEIFYFQVDNPMVRICDPAFVGHHLSARADMSSKVLSKRDAEEKVGVIGLLNGKTAVVEYSDLSAEDKYATLPDGSLKYSAGSIAIHMISVDFVQRVLEAGFPLPYHRAEKKVPYIDDAGKLHEPDEPNGIKFELFVFDALPLTRRSVTMETTRQEFSPVKDAEGLDSPQNARAAMVSLFASWLEAAGINVPRTEDGKSKFALEISPLFALDAEELAAKVDKNLKICGDLYLSE
jgi:UDP-N-acetylglucosamine/UDP-N-acetylgalactosamine diphosphorylase